VFRHGAVQPDAHPAVRRSANRVVQQPGRADVAQLDAREVDLKFGRRRPSQLPENARQRGRILHARLARELEPPGDPVEFAVNCMKLRGAHGSGHLSVSSRVSVAGRNASIGSIAS